VPTFSLPEKRIRPRIVECSPPATKSRIALRSSPTRPIAAVRISRPAQVAPLAHRSGSFCAPNFATCASK